ncbi:MAG: hypothetical protein Q9Q13_02505, partial [Acidobacteriota bacterium]|nr:hypothetical protein [Acidobacteriota bacterium]
RKTQDRFQVGQSVKVKILRTDPVERKIGLSIKEALDALGGRDLESYNEQVAEEKSAASITLGDMAGGELAALRERAAAKARGDENASASEEEPEEDSGAEDA